MDTLWCFIGAFILVVLLKAAVEILFEDDRQNIKSKTPNVEIRDVYVCPTHGMALYGEGENPICPICSEQKVLRKIAIVEERID